MKKLNHLLVLIVGLVAISIPIHSMSANRDDVQNKRLVSSAGIGLTGIVDWSSQFPFLNLMKMSREWYNWKSRSYEGFTLNEEDWPIEIDRGAKVSTVFLTNKESIPVVYSHYIVRWQGKGSVEYKWCAKKVGRAHGGDRIKLGHGSCLLSITKTDRNDPVRNITIVPEKHIAAFDAGEQFNPDFIEKLSFFRAIRFMDWMQTNGSKQKSWADRPLPPDRSYRMGAPIEIMVALANKLSADPWFNIPHLADENYIREFARLVKAQLKPTLHVYIEHSNEVWNWIFSQTHYALKQGKIELGDRQDVFMQWQGMRTAKMCDVWKKSVFKEDPQRLTCVLGTQASWIGLEIPALECPLWVEKGNDPCVESIDAIAIAGYFSGCLNGNRNQDYEEIIIGWSRQAKKAESMEKAYQQVLDGRHFDCDDTLKSVKERYNYFANQVQKYGLRLLAYEGGQHITSNLSKTQNDADFYTFHNNLNRSEWMRPLYVENFRLWREAGGELFMHYSDVTTYGKHGSWGALEYITQADSPKWSELLEYNRQPCWWKACDVR